MKDVRCRLGDRIRVLRKELKLSQEALALKAGLDRTYVASIESGTRNVSILNIERLASSLNISLAEFFGTEEFSQVPSVTTLSKVAEKSSKKYKWFIHISIWKNLINITKNSQLKHFIVKCSNLRVFIFVILEYLVVLAEICFLVNLI